MAKDQVKGVRELEDGQTEFSMVVATADVGLIGEAFAQQYSYSLPELDEGETRTPQEELGLKMAHARERVIDYIKQIVGGYHAEMARIEAQKNIPEVPIDIA